MLVSYASSQQPRKRIIVFQFMLLSWRFEQSDDAAAVRFHRATPYSLMSLPAVNSLQIATGYEVCTWSLEWPVKVWGYGDKMAMTTQLPCGPQHPFAIRSVERHAARRGTCKLAVRRPWPPPMKGLSCQSRWHILVLCPAGGSIDTMGRNATPLSHYCDGCVSYVAIMLIVCTFRSVLAIDVAAECR